MELWHSVIILRWSHFDYSKTKEKINTMSCKNSEKSFVFLHFSSLTSQNTINGGVSRISQWIIYFSDACRSLKFWGKVYFPPRNARKIKILFQGFVFLYSVRELFFNRNISKKCKTGKKLPSPLCIPFLKFPQAQWS